MALDLDLFFLLPALQAIFQLGYEPKEEYFYELTLEQYEKLHHEGKDISKVWYTLLPNNPKYNIPELIVIDEDQKQDLLEASQYIHDMYSADENNLTTDDFDEKLKFAANKLPPHIHLTESTKYEKYRNLSVVK